MKLILTNSIRALEYEALKNLFPLEVLKVAAQKALGGLGESIKNSAEIPHTVLKKVYLTSTGGAGRAIFLLQISQSKSVLVMIRAKNDKAVGANMTVKNSKFKKSLEGNLDRILSDLEHGAFVEYDL